MYAIVVKGEIIQFCNQPWYIKQIEGNDGKPLWVHADNEEEAEAVSVNGTKYNLSTKGENVEGAEMAVIIQKDGPEYIFENRQGVEKTKETTEMIEDALCNTDTEITERLAMLEDALCEMDMAR